MGSYYLTPEASAQRLTALCTRLCGEVVDLGPAGITWMPESDFWRLPERVQFEVVIGTIDRLTTTTEEPR